MSYLFDFKIALSNSFVFFILTLTQSQCSQDHGFTTNGNCKSNRLYFLSFNIIDLGILIQFLSSITYVNFFCHASLIPKLEFNPQSIFLNKIFLYLSST